jgi:hypothetical protein
MSDETNLVKVVHDNLLLHLTPRRKVGQQDAEYNDQVSRAICGKPVSALVEARILKKREKSYTLHQVQRGALAMRWNCAFATLRSLTNGTRQPTLTGYGKLSDDMVKYGAARFRGSKVILDSLGNGQTLVDYLMSRSRARDKRRLAPAERLSA